jgi:apolipoprotein N-acyltransferase
MLWAIPIALLCIGLGYGILFWLIACLSEKIQDSKYFPGSATLRGLVVKALGLLMLSYIHPFGFDWLKPELMFINSYIGIEKWQFALVLAAIVLSIWRKQFLYLFLIVFAYQPTSDAKVVLAKDIELVTTYTSVEEKWDKALHKRQFKEIFKTIDLAIAKKKKLIIMPESVFPVFLNYEKDLIFKLKKRSENISIVVGGLYWDGKTPFNSTYIFVNKEVSIANKVLLVPFGESNPLPDFLSDWVNEVFYDGAVDYKADSVVTDYIIDGKTYRNAICFEATSEVLYEGDPKNMIALSNNGWFTPSTEPTLQRLLLQYYSKKYGTSIYHAVNMSASYIIKEGKLGNSTPADK